MRNKTICINILALIPIALLLFSCDINNEKEQIKNQPNIVLIISDDQAWIDYSFMGHPVIETPQIDKLSGEALTFTRGYVVAPLCRPSLASISTGLYPHQHGITGNDPQFESDNKRYSKEWSEKRSELSSRFTSKFRSNPAITDLLTQKDYVSFQTGKWWEGSWQNGGFTEGMTHGDWSRGGRHGDEGLKVSREGMQAVFNFMKNAKDKQKPFFVWHAPFMPHTPHTPPDSLFQKYLSLADHEREAKYMAMVEWFDITVGQLLDFLEVNELEENTLVIYVCDNGWITNPDPKNGGSFLPRSKQSPYEMGIRTPIMYKWPGVIKPLVDTSTFVSSIDIVPTILDAVGLAKTDKMQGINVLDSALLKKRKMVFSEDFMHDMKDINDISSSLESRVILKSPWKLIVPYSLNNKKEVELFHIINDPHEKNNLFQEFPQVVQELSMELNKFWAPK